MAESSRTSEQNLLIQARLDKQAARKQVIGRIVPYFGLVFLFIFFTIVTKGLFISKKNLTNMVEQCFTMCIVATGAAFVYAQGNMDFSIGSACGVAQMCGAILLLHKGWPMPPGNGRYDFGSRADMQPGFHHRRCVPGPGVHRLHVCPLPAGGSSDDRRCKGRDRDPCEQLAHYDKRCI